MSHGPWRLERFMIVSPSQGGGVYPTLNTSLGHPLVFRRSFSIVSGPPRSPPRPLDLPKAPPRLPLGPPGGCHTLHASGIQTAQIGEQGKIGVSSQLALLMLEVFDCKLSKLSLKGLDSKELRLSTQ